MYTEEGIPRHHVVDGVALTEFRPSTEPLRTPLVFVHGGLHGRWQWDSTQRWFAEAGRSSVALDWFSHGDSRQLDASEWLTRSILDVREEIDTAVAQSASRPVLIGHSMGGLASLAYAATHPSQIAGLVLLAPVAPEAFAGAPVELPIDSNKPWPPPPLDVAAHLFFQGAPSAEHETIYARLQPESPTAVWEATRWTALVNVDAITVPVLVITGDSDELTPVDIVSSLARGIDAELVVLPGVSHGLSFDPSWNEQCARIHSWISRAVSE
ncbi:alpha/beta fold hydrolase [Microbacterium sp. LMC-P-041]|uniref:alpha/beta hydrolase n=1 Tax=Microbacterium sp. LMC-P-041 TaxID=3040293 RepID=UPI002554CFED|nr:alpha/beta fold hydrolase [Microbacterium sp. LMC-P-041]